MNTFKGNFLILITLLPFLCTGNPVLPTSDFTTNFCNFPQAWTLTRGENVNIGIICSQSDKNTAWINKVSELAPGAQVTVITKQAFIAFSKDTLKYHFLLFMETINNFEYNEIIQAIELYYFNGTTVIFPAYIGPIKIETDYSSWKKFINSASETGAIIAGTHGRTYQLGTVSFWENIPVDIYALNYDINGDNYLGNETLLFDIETSACVVTAAVALLKSDNPNLLPPEIKKIVRQKNRPIFWGKIELELQPGAKWTLAWPVMTKSAIDAFILKFKYNNPKLLEIFEGNCLDAGLLLGLKPMGDGEWCRQTLNIDSAQQKATGKGVTVAILDHMFDENDPVFKNRIYKPGSVVDGQPVFSITGHGTNMANDLVNIAPDVKIMPVRICSNEQNMGDPDLYIKGIEYAVENGADIISLSHRDIPQNKQSELDQAVELASKKGIVFVYIHYKGDRTDVVVPGPIEFAGYNSGRKIVYVIGTNFKDDSRFPNTWGLSQTAPTVSGVIALIKEINPALTPQEIKELLLKSYNITESGYPVLDALTALENAIN